MVHLKKERKFELDSDVMAHYESGVEKDRLLKDTERLEFHRTKQIISRYLPKKPATILDIGGGPGVFPSLVGEKGPVVHPVHPNPPHLIHARQQTKQRRISAGSDSFV